MGFCVCGVSRVNARMLPFLQVFRIMSLNRILRLAEAVPELRTVIDLGLHAAGRRALCFRHPLRGADGR